MFLDLDQSSDKIVSLVSARSEPFFLLFAVPGAGADAPTSVDPPDCEEAPGVGIPAPKPGIPIIGALLGALVGDWFWEVILEGTEKPPVEEFVTDDPGEVARAVEESLVEESALVYRVARDCPPGLVDPVEVGL